jgi:hypothetical protein
VIIESDGYPVQVYVIEFVSRSAVSSIKQANCLNIAIAIENGRKHPSHITLMVFDIFLFVFFWFVNGYELYINKNGFKKNVVKIS